MYKFIGTIPRMEISGFGLCFFLYGRVGDILRTLIKNGTLVDPYNHVMGKLNLLMEDGRVLEVTRQEPAVERTIDAAGKVVAPGFIDIHMHEDFVNSDRRLEQDEDKAIFNCMVRMGVTTVLGGECGINRYDPVRYLDLVDKGGAAVNVALLIGNSWLREAMGHKDKYTAVTDDELSAMISYGEKALDAGCFGISFGIRYSPGIDKRELDGLMALCRRHGGMTAAHVRDDAAHIFSAAHEFLDAAKEQGIPAQFSHIGSMAAFGQMEDFLTMIGEYRMNGLDVACDCYPYYAFSTAIGSATYDEGWLARYQCDYDAVEMCEGKYKGQRCTKKIFEEERRNHPEYLTVAYVMKDREVDMALAHPLVMVGSDGILNHGDGHPRAAGAFLRIFSQFVKKGKLSLYDAIDKMTAIPAKRMELARKGRLDKGADADIVIFDPKTITDCATFADPLKPGKGMDYVLVGGEVAVQNNRLVNGHLGKAVRR